MTDKLIDKPNCVAQCLQALREGTESPKTLSRMARAIEMYEEVNEWENQE